MIAKVLTVICTSATAMCAHATQYPLTVTDLSGQRVTIQKEPRHIILQDGRDFMMLATLDRKQPFQRLVAWNNILGRNDAGLWKRLTTQWPAANHILDMQFGDDGQINLEEVMTHQPDIMIAELRAKPALEQGGVIDKLAKLHIPVVFVDTAEHPIKDAPKSVELLGKILNKEAHGQAFAHFYQQHLRHVEQGIQQALAHHPKPSVFIEAHAGLKGPNDCCFTHADFGWGDLVTAAGGNNLGLKVLKSPTGVVAMEKVLEMRPDIYVMTGSQWSGKSQSIALPLGYDVKKQQISAAFDHLLSRPGFKQLSAYKKGRIYGVYHQFYNHPYNIVAVEALAKDFYPQQFKLLNPTRTYETILGKFTGIKPGAITLVAHANTKKSS